MSTDIFTLTEPVSCPRRRVKSSFALTMVSALTFTVGTYNVSATTGDGRNPLFRNAFANESCCEADNAIAALFSSEFSHKEQMLKRLESLYADLQCENWDGYGAVPLESASYLNTKKLVESLTGSQLLHWNLFPSPNGTFLLTAKTGDVASINIGNEEFSFAAMKDGVELMGQEKFDAARAASIIGNIHSILKYNG